MDRALTALVYLIAIIVAAVVLLKVVSLLTS